MKSVLNIYLETYQLWTPLPLSLPHLPAVHRDAKKVYNASYRNAIIYANNIQYFLLKWNFCLTKFKKLIFIPFMKMDKNLTLWHLENKCSSPIRLTAQYPFVHCCLTKPFVGRKLIDKDLNKVLQLLIVQHRQRNVTLLYRVSPIKPSNDCNKYKCFWIY